MMGRTHAVSGAVAMLAAAPAVAWAAPRYAPHGGVQLAAASVVAAGAALLPDLDHPSATVARAFGPVTRLLARLVARASGGHRHGTHSVPAVLLAAAVFGQAGEVGGWWAWTPVVLLAGLAAAAVGLARPVFAVAATAALVAAGVAAGVQFGPWLGVAVGVGVAAHLAGDCATEQGCPLWWPYPRRYRFARLTTGSRVETRFVLPLLVAALAGAVVLRT